MTTINNAAVEAVRNEIATPSILSNSEQLLLSKPANVWIEEAKIQPPPIPIFLTLWFLGEICILFADTNLGKSILAVQIMAMISEGRDIGGFPAPATQQTILYFDFELSAKQFENRCSENYRNHYVFNNSFHRIEINPDADLDGDEDFEVMLIMDIERLIKETDAKVLCIDNLTFLTTDAEKGKNALSLMKKLKVLKNKYHLSILVLAHTPKRDLSKPISKNDLAGSKMLINFCDSAFALGESAKDGSLRYIKQIKARNTHIEYGTDNVIVCEINKPSNFLQFEALDYSTEEEHLKHMSDEDKTELEDNIIALYDTEPSLSFREIARQLDTNPMKVKRTLERR